MPDEFHRIRRLPPYVFAEVNSAKAAARAAGEDIIDLGMGNPDSPTPPHIVAKLVEAVQDPRTHRYSVSRGIPGLRRALAGYYRRRFEVDLDPEAEVVVTLGSKEGLANLASAITTPGDTILVPNPSYPIHQFGFIIAGAAVRSIPASPDEEMLRALDRAVRHSVPKPTALIVNFPSNPTAVMADLDFYRELVTFCIAHESGSCRTWPMRKSISATECRLPFSRCRERRISPSSSPRCPRPIPCRVGEWALRPVTGS